jgi:hypothetical protein
MLYGERLGYTEIRTIEILFENKLHKQLEFRLLLFTVSNFL